MISGEVPPPPHPPPISDVAVLPFVPPRHSLSWTVCLREKTLYKWPSWFSTDEEVAEIVAQARVTNKAILENAAIRLAAAAEEKAAREAEHRKLVNAAGGRKAQSSIGGSSGRQVGLDRLTQQRRLMGRAGAARAKTGNTALAKDILLAFPDADTAEQRRLLCEAARVNLDRLDKQRRRMGRAGEGGDQDGGRGRSAKKHKGPPPVLLCRNDDQCVHPTHLESSADFTAYGRFEKRTRK